MKNHYHWKKDDRCGIGIFATSEDDPFFWECRSHDRGYSTAKTQRDRKKEDDRFIDLMWKRTKKDWRLIPRAMLYSGLVRTIAPIWFGIRDIFK